MTLPSPSAHYLQDLGMLLKEMARAARRDRDAATAEDRQFATGRLMGWHEVISMMQQQARAFAIDLQDINLHDIDPEKELL
jgi:hypothetical protein